MAAEGKLLCTFPGPAIQMPLETLKDECFLREISSFLVQMVVDRLDVTPTTSSAESVHPWYISELLVGILRGYGRPAVVDRITKRISNEVLRDGGARQPWRKSSSLLWLILKVTLQFSSLRQQSLQTFHPLLSSQSFTHLGTAPSHHIGQVDYNTAKETEVLLSKRWTEFQAIGSTSPTLQLEGLDFVADTPSHSRNWLDRRRGGTSGAGSVPNASNGVTPLAGDAAWADKSSQGSICFDFGIQRPAEPVSSSSDRGEPTRRDP